MREKKIHNVLYPGWIYMQFAKHYLCIEQLLKEECIPC